MFNDPCSIADEVDGIAPVHTTYTRTKLGQSCPKLIEGKQPFIKMLAWLLYAGAVGLLVGTAVYLVLGGVTW